MCERPPSMRVQVGALLDHDTETLASSLTHWSFVKMVVPWVVPGVCAPGRGIFSRLQLDGPGEDQGSWSLEQAVRWRPLLVTGGTE